ncbi:glycoside hydrolase family 3 protein [Planosporangium mesophilum]|uniref:beta-N-acetylhexosaminidase n=1 Tax=Planosporangium mesophilum TaxID=689768 RepID=A0A8J3TG99_9ACTN|nr:glycoside hydrolase family 3 protein [Planosporangium mesophilum]NJC85996.1 glycoside hydrolase family 3 protein [Planosporangium mesophilum]GII25903.1 beta-N-acetylhexosaminidase [Planosporangium mesophilum]
MSWHPRSARTVSALIAAAVTVALGAVGPGSASAADRAPLPGCHRPSDLRACAWALATLARMNLEEKVGQLFVTYAYGSTVDTTDAADVAANRSAYGVDNAAALVDKYKLGGIIYFAWSHNVNNPGQIAALSNGVQRTAAKARVPVPMLVGTDQEQGIVVRIGSPATQFPGNMALGADRRTADTRTAASITGQELRAMGINQDYAPVADVNVNPANPVIGVRSFSSDPTLAATLTKEAVTGYQGAGIIATAKHFPGHGDTNVDSHTGIPVIGHTRQQWEQLDRPPFAAAIAAKIDSIMTAHIVVPSLDPSGDPATLSQPIVTGILRKELKYDGVVVTDSLGMAGVRQKYGDDRVPVLALKAGVDQLLMPPDLDLAYRSVLTAVRGGELTERRVNESVLRILVLKYQRGLVANPYVDESTVSTTVGTADHVAVSQAVTDRTTTLVRNDRSTLPVAARPGLATLVTGWGVATTSTLAATLGRRGLATDALTTGISPTQAQIDAAVAAAGSHELTVVTTNGLRSNPQQRRLVEALQATGTKLVVVAVAEPYDIAYVPSVPTYLATYSYTAVGLESLTRVLLGEVSPTGRLPITIPAAESPSTVLYPFGHGLSYPG